MNAPKCSDVDYINFLHASPKNVTAMEAARSAPLEDDPVAHDTYTRLLHRLDPSSDALWEETAPLVQRESGFLIIDDTTLDKPYAKSMELVTKHWSGKHHAVVSGINLITLLWTDGAKIFPIDYRIYQPSRDQRTKHDHFQEMLRVAHTRGFQPTCVLFDTWYSSMENLKIVRSLGWHWLTQLQSNRHVDPGFKGNFPVKAVVTAAAGHVVHLKGYGMVRVFRIVSADGDTEYWATSDTTMSHQRRKKYARIRWTIEQYHRGIKQHCGVERAQVRAAHAQRVHIGLAIRAFIRLEYQRITQGLSWAEAKLRIFREAVREYRQSPLYQLPMATA